MSNRRRLWISLGLTALLWLVFSWPLPRCALRGIPSSSANIEQPAARRMIHGDHLQLLYNYWLVSDWIGGGTPWFHNLYEFNTGDDAERRYVGLDYLPFTVIFSAGYALLGRAGGWNLTGLVSLWFTFYFTWLLTRRYARTAGEGVAAAAALLAVALPYRWATLCGGSPTGHAMMAVPMLLWGIEGVLREQRPGAGCLAAFAVLIGYWTDAHVFFFSLLLGPAWGLLVLAHEEGVRWKDLRWWRRTALAAAPAILAVAATAALGQMKKSGMETTTLAAGRSIQEVLLSTPVPAGLWTWRGHGHEGSIYLGLLLPLGLLAGLAPLGFLLFRRERGAVREALFYLLLLAGLAGVVLLALGPRGPFDGRCFSAARKLLPPYAMIRQTTKIMCLLPPLLAVGAAAAAGAWAAGWRGRPRMLRALLLVPLALVLVEYDAQVRPTVCLLDREQGAYAAVARDAAARGEAPRAIVLPLWPGDSAWASLYEHYVSLYRIRMIGGYLPVLPARYVEGVFQALESVNCGVISDGQLAQLRRAGIRYLLLHENAFPEKVSWFPVAFTLNKLLTDPRLERLAQDGPVWAFRIADADAPPRAAGKAPVAWTRFCPNLHSEMEHETRSGGAETLEDDTASRGRFVRLAAEGAAAGLDPFEHLEAPDPILLLRVRGEGELLVRSAFDDDLGAPEQVLSVRGDRWHWQSLPLGELGASRRVKPELLWRAGRVDVDLLLYSSGPWDSPAPGEAVAWSAPLFFHAGHTVLDEDAVRFLPDRDPADRILYGPKLPLPEGDYDVELLFDTPAAPGTAMGKIRVDIGGRPSPGDAPVVAGQPAVLRFSTVGNDLPLEFGYVYNRAAEITLRQIIFRRLP